MSKIYSALNKMQRAGFSHKIDSSMGGDFHVDTVFGKAAVQISICWRKKMRLESGKRTPYKFLSAIVINEDGSEADLSSAKEVVKWMEHACTL